MENDEFHAFYENARKTVQDHGFEQEIAWQHGLRLQDLSESAFLKEAAWVVLNSGFREETARKLFPYISLCFFDWSCADEIKVHSDLCRATSLPAFGNVRKINAIIEIACRVSADGFEGVRSRLGQDPIEYLQTFPMIGPITCFHLAKNLGLDVAKPDRHLQRLAIELQRESVQSMCAELATFSGDRVSVVDLVLWRYCTLRSALTEAA